MIGVKFHKSLGDFDRIEIDSTGESEWVTLTMHVGNAVEDVRMEFRSTEAVRDLHYGIGAYLAELDRKRSTK